MTDRVTDASKYIPLYYLRFSLPVFFPEPMASPFFARTPSERLALWPISLSKAPLIFGKDFRRFGFSFDLAVLEAGACGIPILDGRADFLADLIAALTVPSFAVSFSRAILRRLALRERPAYLSLLGYKSSRQRQRNKKKRFLHLSFFDLLHRLCHRL